MLKKNYGSFLIFSFIFGVFCTFQASSAQEEARAQKNKNQKLTVYGAIGQPAPSWFGMTLGYQALANTQLTLGTGWLWSNDVALRTHSAQARFHILPHSLSPIVGGGVSYLQITGAGDFRTLNESTVLALMLVGLDMRFEKGLRIGAGWIFHFPLNLNFPFVEVGFSF
jgi:hypothetical protein